MGHVIVETDAAEVVQAVYSNAFEFSAATNLVDELRSILANFISRSVPSAFSFSVLLAENMFFLF